MSLINAISRWLYSLFRANPVQQHEPEVAILFPQIHTVDKPPRNEQVARGFFYYVRSGSQPRWSLFRCPCGCGDVITLSLQFPHNPHWQLASSDSGRPTLFPSVWRDKGCLSHFWLKDGRVFWCHDSGSHPDLRQLYQRPSKKG